MGTKQSAREVGPLAFSPGKFAVKTGVAFYFMSEGMMDLLSDSLWVSKIPFEHVYKCDENLFFERVLPRDGIMHIGVTVRGDEETIDKIARFLRRAGFICFKVVEDDTAGLQTRADVRADIASVPVAAGLLN